MSAAPKIDVPTPPDDDETLLVSRQSAPASTTRPSAAPELARDTICDPPQAPWYVSLFRGVLTVLLFVPGVVAYWILREWRSFWVRFEEPPLSDLLPSPALPLTRRHDHLTREQLAEQVAFDLFLVDPRYLPGIFRVARGLHDTRRYNAEDRLDLFVHYNLSRLTLHQDDLVPLAWIRRRLPHVDRRDLNASLERLAEEKWIELEDPGTNDVGYVAQGLTSPRRKLVTHARVLR